MADLLNDADIDFDRAASAFPDISLDADGDLPTFASPSVPATAPPAPGGAFDLHDFSSPPPPREVKVTGYADEAIEQFENEFPELDVSPEPAPQPTQPTFGATPTFAPRPQQSALSATPILAQQLDAEEPEAIREWRERQAEEIKARDDAAKARRQETVAKAERAIDQFYEEYTAKRERQIRENKDAEAEYLGTLTDALSRGTTWDRILDTVELQNSQSKTLARAGPGTTELSRFREVLLRLRREGASAPGAAGY
ncbi:clathrin light chain-domain-containing protein [Gloeopeniophorella convolvens]|nr:clathrin light chain-domain-containing protein [Gloeopeniophorella convolvens]